jgi:membrane dipeptidase
VFATIFTAPLSAGKLADPLPALIYRTAREAHLVGQAQVGYYRSVGLSLVTSREDLQAHGRNWRPGKLAAVMLMENADPIETPSQVGLWASLGVRIIGPAWMRTRYCGGTHAPGGLTTDGKQLLLEMARHSLILDLSHMADRAVRDSLELWRGPLVVTHAGARAINPGQRQISDRVIEEVGRRDGVLGISFYAGHLRAEGRAGPADIARHARHMARTSGDPRHVAIGSDLDGGFGRDKAAVSSLADLGRVRTALSRYFSVADTDGIMGRNWLRFLRGALPRAGPTP